MNKILERTHTQKDTYAKHDLKRVNYLLNEHDLQNNDLTFLKLLKETLECGDKIEYYQRDLLNVMFVGMYEYEPSSDILEDSSNMQYLIKKKGFKARAHLWDDKKQDTKCRMYSTGGLYKDKYSLYNNRRGKDICINCINNS